MPPKRRQAVGQYLGRSLVGEYRKVAWSSRCATPIQHLLAERRARVLSAVRGARGLTAAGEPPPTDPFGSDSWSDDVATTVQPAVDGVFADVSQAGARMFGEGVQARLPVPDYTTQVARLVGQVDGLGPDVAAAIGRTLTAGFAAGESYPKLGARVAQEFGVADWRALMIARTEVTRGVEDLNNGYALALRDSGLTMVKQWLDAENACPECVELAQEGSVPADATFSDGSYEPPDPHPNCRCSLAYDTEGGPVVSELDGGPYPGDVWDRPETA